MAYGDLTNLADVKAWLQTGQSPFPSTDDLLLQRLITAASDFIQNWLGRHGAAAAWLEGGDGTGGPPPRRPGPRPRPPPRAHRHRPRPARSRPVSAPSIDSAALAPRLDALAVALQAAATREMSARTARNQSIYYRGRRGRAEVRGGASAAPPPLRPLRDHRVLRGKAF